MNEATILATLPALPVELIDIKLKLQSLDKSPATTINGELSVYDQVYKTSRIDFTPGSKITFENLNHPWVVLYADIINLNGSAEITRTSKIDLKGKNGKNGASAPQTTPGLGSAGFSGEPGGQGTDGKSQNIPILYIFTQQLLWQGIQAKPQDIQNNLSISMNGYPGGDGGNGGNGGNGSNGRQGEASRGYRLVCDAGPGWGGRGGDGGRGGAPGIGGNGTDGGAIYVFTPPIQITSFNAAAYNVKFGQQGKNGRPGKSGAAGSGGNEGELNGGCHSAGRRGRDGVSLPVCGLPDISGMPGVAGPQPSIQAYTGFAELQKI